MSALNDLPGPSAGPLARITFHSFVPDFISKKQNLVVLNTRLERFTILLALMKMLPCLVYAVKCYIKRMQQLSLACRDFFLTTCHVKEVNKNTVSSGSSTVSVGIIDLLLIKIVFARLTAQHSTITTFQEKLKSVAARHVEVSVYICHILL